MLFTSLKRPLDLRGTSELNRAADEKHSIRSEPDRIFVPQLGPFYKDSMIVVDVQTGRTLVEKEDYRLLHMVSAATDESNKEVDCVVYILNKTISDVLITYQAVGGVYAEGSMALLEILERFKAAKLPPIYWVNILDKPDTFPVTPHRHTIYDLEALEGLISALTRVYDQMNGRDIPKFQTLYDNLDEAILGLENLGNDFIQTLEQGFMRIESNMLYRRGNIKITDDNANPYDYLGYGSWQRLENVFLYGTIPGASEEPITDISDATGLIARKTNFWEQISDVDGVSFVLTASASNINEGQSVTFTLRSTGLSEGTVVPFKLDGISGADITTALNGNFVINAAGIGSVVITTVEDRLTEGVESMGLYLTNYPSIRRTVKINDTSRSASFNVSFSTTNEGTPTITQANEGSRFYIYISSEFVDDGTVINLFYTGSTVTNADFNSNLPSQATISGGRAWIQLDIKPDQLTEGNEILYVGVSMSSADAIIASNVLTIRDTSRSPTYRIVFSSNDGVSVAANEISSVNEGVEFWGIIYTENVANGTVLQLAHSGVSLADFDLLFPPTITVNNNFANFKMKMANDLITEGVEWLTLSVLAAGSSIAASSIQINDTSQNPNAQLRFSSNTTGTNTVSQANEGDTLYLIITTNGLPNGTALQLVYFGSADTSDFSEALPGSVIMNDNRAVVRFPIRADSKTEGNETISVELRNPATALTLGTVNLTILDTSKNSSYDLYFSRNENGGARITNANEGEVIWAIIACQDVDNGTVLNVSTTIGGRIANVANGDVTANVQTTVTINNNFASIRIPLNNDNTDEDAETLNMSLSKDGILITAASMVVNDTSRAPTYATRLLQGTIGDWAGENSPAAQMIMVNMFYAAVLQTTNVPDGTTFYVRRNDAVGAGTQPVGYLNDAAFAVAPSKTPDGSCQVWGGKAHIHFKISPSYITDSNKEFALGFYTSASGGAPVAVMRTIFGNPSYENWFSSQSNGTDRITAVNEGSDAYYVIETLNVPFGTLLYDDIYINGRIPTVAELQQDVYGTPYSAVNIDSGRVVLKYPIIADNSIEEGNETFGIRLRPYTEDGSVPWYRDTSVTIIDTSKMLLVDWVYQDLHGLMGLDSLYTNWDSQYNQRIDIGGNIKYHLAWLGYDLSKIYRLNLRVPYGKIIGGTTYVSGVPHEPFGDVYYKAGIYFGPEFSNIDVHVYVDGWVFGTGGWRSVNGSDANLNGSPAIENKSGRQINVHVGSTAWICGGGGAGEGNTKDGYRYAGGGAPYGPGYKGGGQAKLTTGGPQNNLSGNNGGNVGRKGDGSGAGQRGVDIDGLVNITGDISKIGPR